MKILFNLRIIGFVLFEGSNRKQQQQQQRRWQDGPKFFNLITSPSDQSSENDGGDNNSVSRRVGGRQIAGKGQFLLNFLHYIQSICASLFVAVLGGTHRSSLSMLGGWTVAVRNSISRNRQLSLNDRALHNFVRKSVGSLVWFSLMLERGRFVPNSIL